MNKTMIRPGTLQDIEAVTGIYHKITAEEEQGRCTIGWQKGVYPTRQTALEALEKQELYVLEEDGEILAAMRLNQDQVPEYDNCAWEFPAAPEEVMVMHTLVVDPIAKKRGYGRQMVAFYEDYAWEHHCPYLRIDTNEKNVRARAMYQKFGYHEVGITPCTFNGIAGVNLVCIEKKLEKSPEQR